MQENRRTRSQSSLGPASFAVRSSVFPPEPVPSGAATLDTMAEQDEPESTEPDPVGRTPGARGVAGWNQWVRRNFSAERLLRPRPAARVARPASDDSGLTPAQRAAATKKAVNNLDDRERKIGFLALAFELALTAIIVVPYLTHHVKLSKANGLKTMAAVHDFLLEGIVVGIFLLIGTLLKRRALLGFGALAAGIWLAELPSLRIFGLAFLALGMWLLLKGLKSQQGAGRGPRGAPSQPRRANKARGDAKAGATRAAPKPSKRYTPPKPTRRPAPKKPAPVRAEPHK